MDISELENDEVGENKIEEYTPVSLETLPYESLFEIAYNLEYPDVLSLCNTSTRYSDICSCDTFWIRKSARDLGLTIDDVKNTHLSPRERYLQLITVHLNAAYIGSEKYTSIDNLLKRSVLKNNPSLINYFVLLGASKIFGLYGAIESNNIELFKHFYDNGAVSTNSINELRKLHGVIRVASRIGSIEMVMMLFQTRGLKLIDKIRFSREVFNVAGENGHVELLNYIWNTYQSDNSYFASSLERFAKGNQLESIQFIEGLDKFAELDNNKKLTAYFGSIEGRVSAGALVGAVDSKYDTSELITYLIAKINMLKGDNQLNYNNILINAARYNKLQEFKRILLLQNLEGHNVDWSDMLLHIVGNGDSFDKTREMIEYFLSQGAVVSYSTLGNAVQGDVETFKFLSRKIPNFQLPTEELKDYIEMASIPYDDIEMIKYLISIGASITRENISDLFVIALGYEDGPKVKTLTFLFENYTNLLDENNVHELREVVNNRIRKIGGLEVISNRDLYEQYPVYEIYLMLFNYINSIHVE